MGRRPSATAAVLILGLLGTACEPSRTPVGDDTPIPGGQLVVAVRDLGTLDVNRASGRGALLAVGQVYESLTAIDPGTNEVVPAAAASWQASDDGLRWVFRVREGATFHDGSAVTAGDFKRSFDRVTRKRTASDAAFQLEQVKGFRASHTLGTAARLEGVRAPSATRLEIVLERPYAELPYALAHPSLGPLHRSQDAGANNLASAPIGNGPFKVAAATLEEEATLERVESYEPTPFLDGVRLVVESDTDAGWRRFLREEIDVAEAPISEFTTARGRFGEGGFTPQWSTLSFGPNLKLEKYRSREVRRALSLAIDRDAIVAGVYGDTKDPATGIVPRGMRGYVPDACAVCVRDVERASQIVAAAFGSKPPRIAIDHLNDPASRAVARAIGNQLKEIGFDAVLRAHAPGDYLKVLREGRHDFAQLGWLADVPSPDGFLAQQLRTGSPNNQTGFTDQTFDGLIDAARKTPDEDARLAKYVEAETRALELMPLIPIVFFRNRTAVNEQVRDLVVDGAGLFDAGTVWLAR